MARELPGPFCTEYCEVVGEATIPYVVYGEKPVLGIIASVHGDEYESTNAVAHVIQHTLQFMPSFFFIPEASPSAVHLGTENNAWGRNINRCFHEDTPDDEVQAVMRIIKRFGPLPRIVTCHEDEENLPFYLYHVGKIDSGLRLENLRKHMMSINMGLHTGIDVPASQDSALGFYFDQGYNFTAEKPEDGTMEFWLLHRKIAQTIYTVELPMGASMDQKVAAYEGIFSHMLLPESQVLIGQYSFHTSASD